MPVSTVNTASSSASSSSTEPRTRDGSGRAARRCACRRLTTPLERVGVLLQHLVEERRSVFCATQRQSRRAGSRATSPWTARSSVRAAAQGWRDRDRPGRCDVCGEERVVGEVGAEQDQQVGLVGRVVARRRSRAGRSCRRRRGCRTGSTPCRAASVRPGTCSVPRSAMTSSWAPADAGPAEERHRARGVRADRPVRASRVGRADRRPRTVDQRGSGRSGAPASGEATSPGMTSTGRRRGRSRAGSRCCSSRGICGVWRPARSSGCIRRTAGRGGSPGRRCADLLRGMCEAMASTGAPLAVSVVQAVDQVQVARPAAARADREPAGELRLGPAAKAPASSLRTWIHSMPSVAADRVHEGVQAVTDHAVHTGDAGLDEDVDELLSDGAQGGLLTSRTVRRTWPHRRHRSSPNATLLPFESWRCSMQRHSVYPGVDHGGI